MDFYYTDRSPFCRSVMLTAKAVGVQLNKIEIIMEKGEQMSPAFVAINPQHFVPVLIDGDLKLWESRAICTYLVSQYGKNDSLYPQNPRKRVLIDKLLAFDQGTLSDRIIAYLVPVAFQNTPPDPEKKKRMEEAFGWLNGFLEGHNFSVGNTITVADFVLIATVLSAIKADFIDVAKYPNVDAWVKRCQTKIVGYESENEKGAKNFGDFMKQKFQAYK